MAKKHFKRRPGRPVVAEFLPDFGSLQRPTSKPEREERDRDAEMRRLQEWAKGNKG
jgi:hypothetical protein